jgi:AmmeMemoRadiSam system protein B
MHIREPAVAGGFYPFGSSELRRDIGRYFSESNLKERNVVAIISPHAGYKYCGKTAATAYSAVADGFDSVVVIGPNHMGIGSGIATSSSVWKTPIGSVKPDEEFIAKLMEGTNIEDDYRAHQQEHSIEVQLPWLQHKFKDFKFVPICINPIYFNKETCKEIGDKIAEVSKKLNRKVLIVGSSDFTHYGSLYGYQPFRGPTSQILKKIKEIDMEVAGYTTKFMPERLLEVVSEKRYSVCGYGAIATAIYAAKSLGAKDGEVVDYSTSFDISRDIKSVVAYCGIILY